MVVDYLNTYTKIVLIFNNVIGLFGLGSKDWEGPNKKRKQVEQLYRV